MLFGASRAGKNALGRGFLESCPASGPRQLAFAVVRTIAIIEPTLLDPLSDVKEIMDPARSTEAAVVEVLKASKTHQRE